MSSPILITLDGNIGAGKSTLLEAIRTHIPFVTVIPEPVAEWLTMKNEEGESLISLFYNDKRRWAYTFQNCAILTRLLDTQRLIQTYAKDTEKPQIIITERSVLTDRYVFAEMLHAHGCMDELEWNLYLKWFNHFARDLPVKGILYLTTSPQTSQDRIHIRGRPGEEGIPLTYLNDLATQHDKWIRESHLPSLSISTEPGADIDHVISQITTWLHTQFPDATPR